MQSRNSKVLALKDNYCRQVAGTIGCLLSSVHPLHRSMIISLATTTRMLQAILNIWNLFDKGEGAFTQVFG